VILVAAPLLHHDPAAYPNPSTFDPDRFIGKRPSPNSWVPFGGGLRRCPGAAFAHMEMDIVLRTLARNAELDSTRRRSERWLFRGLAFAPARGGRAAFTRTSSSHRTGGNATRRELALAD
jgi:cytochrome P450